MQVRPGFSIAIQTNHDILLVDEVLAVGDEAFPHECMENIEEIRRNGKTILFVSHELAQIRAVCKTCMLLQHGQITASGTPDELISQYHRTIEGAAAIAEKSALYPGHC